MSEVKSLYERVGGETAVMAAVDLFYQKVLADEVTRPFFEALDMHGQIQKQIAFMTWAFGGPNEYRGRDLKTAHAALVRDKGLSDLHFDAVAKHLESTLQELGLEEGIIKEVLGIIGSTRGLVLGRTLARAGQTFASHSTRSSSTTNREKESCLWRSF
jgi:hemoglobin